MVVRAPGSFPGVIENADLAVTTGALCRLEAEESQEFGLGQRRVGPQGDHEVESGGVVEGLGQRAKQLRERQRARVIGHQNQDPLPRETPR